MSTAATVTEERKDVDEGVTYSAEEQAGFLDGFGKKAGEKTDAPLPVVSPEEKAKADAEAAEKAKADEAKRIEDERIAAENRPVELTQKRYDELITKVNSVDELKAAMEQRFGTAFGKMGGLERILTDFQKSQAAGSPVTLAPEDLAELRKEYPEVTAELEKGLVRIFGKLKVGAPAAPALDAATLEPLVAPLIDKAVKTATADVRMTNAMNDLEERHPNWAQIVGPVDEKGVPTVDTDYRKWLRTQTPEEQTRISNSLNPVVVAGSIDAFLEHQKKTKAPSKTAADDRRARLEQGIQPRGSAPAAPKGKTIEDEFEEGFKTGRT